MSWLRETRTTLGYNFAHLWAWLGPAGPWAISTISDVLFVKSQRKFSVCPEVVLSTCLYVDLSKFNFYFYFYEMKNHMVETIDPTSVLAFADMHFVINYKSAYIINHR